jgi:hypothetical protein
MNGGKVDARASCSDDAGECGDPEEWYIDTGVFRRPGALQSDRASRLAENVVFLTV